MDISNRLLLAMVVVFGGAPIALSLLEDLYDEKVPPSPQLVLGITALLVVIADRIYLILKSRQKNQ